MPMPSASRVAAVLALALCAAPAGAKVAPEEAAKLGTELTPIGAEKGANADGTIPAWTPIEKKGALKGEFPSDAAMDAEKPLFTITKANMAQYDKVLTAGHKKDIVITNRLTWKPKKVAIYGWHYPGGGVVQDLCTVHGDFYADYSHGVRLVHGTMIADGETREVAEVLTDPILSVLLSDEGPLHVVGYPSQVV